MDESEAVREGEIKDRIEEGREEERKPEIVGKEKNVIVDRLQLER